MSNMRETVTAFLKAWFTVSKVSDCECTTFCEYHCGTQYYAVMKEIRTTLPFLVQHNGRKMPILFTNRCHESDINPYLVDVWHIDCVCFYIKTDWEFGYLIEPINILEVN